MTTATTIDEQAADEFAGRLLDIVTGAALSCLVDVGHRTGLFAAAAAGPATSAGLAGRAGLHERYVREWLGAMTTAGIVEHSPANGTFSLPHEHAVSLTGDGVANLAPMARLTTLLAGHVPAVADAFRHGGGVPYAAYTPEIHEVMDELWKPMYEQLLVPAILPLAPGVSERLTAGGRAIDVACGCGNALLVLAAAFPAATFVGYDLDEGALVRGRAAASAAGLGNVMFEHCDAAVLRVAEPVDVAFVFNAVHDQVAPTEVLRRIREALVPGGVLVMDEPCLGDRLEDNVGNPMAPFVYAVSTMHCLTVSLAAGGVGIGTAWSEASARAMLADAGFDDVAVYDAPGDPGNAVYVCR